MKNIIIVGAERGLGLGLAEQLLQRNWAVTATAREGTDTTALLRLAEAYPGCLEISAVDVTDAGKSRQFAQTLHEQPTRFDVVYLNAGIFGPTHQSATEATDAEWDAVFHTNTIGPFRLAKWLLPSLKPRGTIAFMSSHRASIAGNIEGGLELYRASKAALNMLSRGLYADLSAQGCTVLNIHPGWAATAMGTLDGTVEAEISVATSVKGVADQVEREMGSGLHRYLDYEGNPLPW